jgi:hypothetical protein
MLDPSPRPFLVWFGYFDTCSSRKSALYSSRSMIKIGPWLARREM